MKMLWKVLISMLIYLTSLKIRIHAANEEPLVFVPLLIRNKEHTLPYFLKLFEELDYPKDRMVLW
jgi:collagen beta-1,O-galactosyltransferase